VVVGDFESEGRWPPGWVRNRCEIVTADDAPDGGSYCRMSGANRSLFRVPQVQPFLKIFK